MWVITKWANGHIYAEGQDGAMIAIDENGETYLRAGWNKQFEPFDLSKYLFTLVKGGTKVYILEGTEELANSVYGAVMGAWE